MLFLLCAKNLIAEAAHMLSNLDIADRRGEADGVADHHPKKEKWGKEASRKLVHQDIEKDRPCPPQESPGPVFVAPFGWGPRCSWCLRRPRRWQQRRRRRRCLQSCLRLRILSSSSPLNHRNRLPILQVSYEGFSSY